MGFDEQLADAPVVDGFGGEAQSMAEGGGPAGRPNTAGGGGAQAGGDRGGSRCWAGAGIGPVTSVGRAGGRFSTRPTLGAERNKSEVLAGTRGLIPGGTGIGAVLSDPKRAATSAPTGGIRPGMVSTAPSRRAA